MNPLMQKMGPASGINQMMQMMSNLKSMFSGKDPNSVLQILENQNPQFAKFVKENQGKTPDEIAGSYGIDWNFVQKFL